MLPRWGWFLVRWFFKLLPLAAVVVFLNFYLPGHDIVRVVGTEVNRVDETASSIAEGAPVTRDVRYINAVRPNGAPAVYRNEDTRWGFPWYMKFDSGNVQAVAQDLISTGQAPRWILVTHYGWRIELFSMFPNVVDIETVAGPDVRIIPWFNIILLTLLAVAWFLLWRAWRRLLDRLALDDRFENASNSIGQIWRWLRVSLRGGRRAVTRPKESG